MYKKPNQINESLNISETLFYLSELGQIYCNLCHYHNELTNRNCLYIEEYVKKLSACKYSRKSFTCPQIIEDI